jgi:hypothetical protein
MRGVPWVIAHLYMTLDPSRHLRRLSPVRAARPSRFTVIEHVLSSAVGHAVRASFLVVFQRTPLHRHTQFASCPGSPKRGPFGLTLLHARLLPPLPFLPTSVVYSAHCATGLLHPVASHEVRAVSGRASLSLCFHNGAFSLPFPGSLFIPSEVFSSAEAVPRLRGRYRLAVAGVDRFQSAPAQPHGFTPLQNALWSVNVSAACHPLLPWALFPFKALPSKQVLS